MTPLTYECVRACECVCVVQVDACELSIYNFTVKTLHVIVRDSKDPTILSPCLSLPPCGQHDVRHLVSNNTDLSCVAMSTMTLYAFFFFTLISYV